MWNRLRKNIRSLLFYYSCLLHLLCSLSSCKVEAIKTVFTTTISITAAVIITVIVATSETLRNELYKLKHDRLDIITSPLRYEEKPYQTLHIVKNDFINDVCCISIHSIGYGHQLLCCRRTILIIGCRQLLGLIMVCK